MRRSPRATLARTGRRAAGAALAGTALAALPLALGGGAQAGSNGSTNTVVDRSVAFSAATVVDPLLFGGEPGIHVDPTSNGSRLFVDWPVSSRQNIGVLFRSQNGGLSFTKRYSDGAACSGRQTPFCFSGGGGDTNIEINPTTGVVYMGTQEVLVNQAVGASFDHGTSFPESNVDPVVGKTATGVDRQWLGSVAGTKTAYLAYHVPELGEFVNRTDNAGATGSWSTPAGPSIPGVVQSGSLVVDNTHGIHRGALYIGYLGGLSGPGGFQVGVSTDGAKTFTSHTVPGGTKARNFTVVGLDRVGNLYATYVDNTTQQTYLTTSKADVGANRTAPGSVWSTPVQISAKPLTVTIFSNIAAGDPGRVAIGYYGTTANATTPDGVAKGAGGWRPYIAVSTDALCQWSHTCAGAGPAFHQAPIAHQINQDDNICTSGTACAATMGNRNLLDYFAISMDPAGHLAVVWADTTNGIGLPFVKVARQVSGPSLLAGGAPAGGPSRVGVSGVSAAAGDALYPIAGTQILTAPTRPTLDLTGASAALHGSTLELTMKLVRAHGPSDLSNGIPGAGSTVDGLTPIRQAKYLFRWDMGGQSYYAGANVAPGGAETATFFSGAVNSGEAMQSALANTSPYGNTYAAQGPATGRVVGNTLVVDVPTSAVGTPTASSTLVSFGAYTMLGGPDAATLVQTAPITVDSTPTADVTLGAAAVKLFNGGTGPSVAPAVHRATSPSTTTTAVSAVRSGSLATTGLPAGLALAGAGCALLGALGWRRRRTG